MPMSAGMTPSEVLLVAALAVAAGAAVVVWLGAGAAAVTVGAPPPGGPIDALAIIPQLVSTPGDPATAWSARVAHRVELPPVGVYWAATGVTAAVLLWLLGLCRRLWRSVSSPTRRRLGVDAAARFATRRELRPLLIRRPVPGRFVFGRRGRWLVATESTRWAPNHKRGLRRVWARLSGELRHGRPGDVTSVAIVGPTRSGKTAECAIPGVLDWVGPAILLSVKRDLLDITIARRRRLGAVRVFDPGGFLAKNQNPHVTVADEELARWSPLRNADTATGAKRAGEALAAWTPQAGVEGGMSFWTTQGKLLFSGLLAAAALDEQRSMRELAHWVFNMSTPGDGNPAGCRPADIVAAALDDPDPAVAEAAEAAILHLAAIWNKPDEKLKANVYSTAVTVCDPWLDPHVIAATDLDPDNPGEWVDLDWLMDTGPAGDQANTLYLLVSTDDYARLAPVLAGLLSDLKAQAYEWEMIGRRLPAPLLMLIDEAGNMPLEWLPEVSSTCAGIGIQLVTVWQSLAQIHEAYGRRADTLLTNHATKLFFPAASDESTLGYQSKIAGDEEVERRSWSSDIAAAAHRSISGQDSHEPLVPYFLARLPRFGQALMIHSNTPPAHLSGRPWWRTKRLAHTVPKAIRAPRRRHERIGRGPWIPTPPVERIPRQPSADPAEQAQTGDERCVVEEATG
jgi:type IV secretion system protein VirD4